MKRFKLLDLIVQALLIGSSFIYYAGGKDFTIYPYFAVGGWQLFSCLIHFIFNNTFLPSGERKQYLKTVMWVLIIAVVSFPLIIFVGFGLLVVSPVLAIWYTMICWSEYRNLKAREFIHLK